MSLDGILALGDAVQIRQYALYTAPFFIKETPIIGYMGTMELQFPNDRTQAGYARLLLELAPYLGIGAKTSLGAGGVTVKIS